MLVYCLLIAAILSFALYFEYVNSKSELSVRKKRLPNYFITIPSFAVLYIVSAFRGNFATDYDGYVNLFHFYNNYGFFEVLKADIYQENGYIALSRFVGLFTDNPVYLYMVISFITLFGFLHHFNKHSAYVWLSILMFVTVGSFYTSFNAVRQILAASIIIAGSKYLYDRKLLKYVLVVLLASLFHRSALIMIVFYFLLNLKIELRNLFILFVVTIVTTFFLYDIIAFVQRYAYSVYTSDEYGMTGLAFTNAVIPIAITAFCLIYIRKIDTTNTKHRIWLNAVVFYAVFNILGLKVQMVQRLAEFFSPYSFLLVPLIFYNMKNTYLKALYMLIFIILLVLYNYITLNNSGYDPYYFIWDMD